MVNQTQDTTRIHREKTKEAINLAMESRWEDAARVNRELLELMPDDLDASNRLGKALLELGDRTSAREAFERSLKLSPGNTIAKRNLERLANLKDAPAPKGVAGRRLSPMFFIEESGKTTAITLHDALAPHVRASLSAGMPAIIRRQGSIVDLVNDHGDVVGRLPIAIASRLITLMEGGNKYEAGLASVNGDHVTVLLRETYQHPSLRRVVSFPSKEVVVPVTEKPEPEVEENEDAELENEAAKVWGQDEEEENGEEEARPKAKGRRVYAGREEDTEEIAAEEGVYLDEEDEEEEQ